MPPQLNHVDIRQRLDQPLSTARSRYWYQNPNIDPYPLLYIAARNGHVETVEEVLQQKKINLNYIDRDFGSLLYIACKHGHKEIVKILIANPDKIDINQRIGLRRTTALKEQRNKAMTRL